MNEDESNNLAPAGTETVDTSTPDNLDDFDYYDPEEDTVAAEDTTATEEEGEAAAEGADAETEAEDPEAAQKDDVTVLIDGVATPLDELKSGYMRQADYTRKTQAAAEAWRALEANSTRIENVTQAFVDHLASLVPQEPSPALAMTNPSQYTAQKAQYDAAIAQVQRLVEIGTQAKTVVNDLTQEQRNTMLQAENARLMEAVPATRNPQGRQEFFTKAMDAAARFGFTQQEFGAITDHRMLLVLDMAAKGAAAVKAREAAKSKVANVPPATPKPKPGQSASPSVKNSDAMRRLSRSGSLADALKVDWD